MISFRSILICTAIHIIILAVISAVGMALEQHFLLDSAFSVVWVAALVLWVLWLIAHFILTIGGDREAAVGILAGLDIGIVALGITCFANMQTGF